MLQAYWTRARKSFVVMNNFNEIPAFQTAIFRWKLIVHTSWIPLFSPGWLKQLNHCTHLTDIVNMGVKESDAEKYIFDKNTAFLTVIFQCKFPAKGCCSAFFVSSTPLTLLYEWFEWAYTNILDILDMWMKEFGAANLILIKLQLLEYPFSISSLLWDVHALRYQLFSPV